MRPDAATSPPDAGTPSTPVSEIATGGDSGGQAHALILYDSTGPFGHLGELYAIGAANLVGHFGRWTAKPVTSYSCGELGTFTATIYMGSTYNEPLPTCLLDDVLATQKPVIWNFYNAWKLMDRAGANGAFEARFGFAARSLDTGTFNAVRYKGRSLKRYAGNAAGLVAINVTDATKATVLAEAVRANDTRSPWAVRSGHLTLVGEIPFTYMSEEDRFLVFADLLFDALAPNRPTRHRALVRLEDIVPTNDPQRLREIADLLHGEGVPFGFGVVAERRDPRGHYNGGVPLVVTMKERPELVAALRYLVTKGGVPVMHGYTHQWDEAPNPYTGVSADDTEFFRVTENPDHTVTFVGPLPVETPTWILDRIAKAHAAIAEAKLPEPTIFEFPHYSGSAMSYRTIATKFTTRWERTLYFKGLLRGGAIDHSQIFGQLVPYVVKDVYGTKVLPENLGNIEPTKFYSYPTRSAADIVNAAEKNLVVRDGVVGFYFHPFFDVKDLAAAVKGIKALGYTFVSPTSL